MHRIVVASDLAMTHDTAFGRGCELAATNCAELHVLRLASRYKHSASPAADGAAMLAEARARFPSIASITISAPIPRSARTIAARAGELRADIIVMRNEIDPNQVDDRPFDLIVDVARRTSIPVLAAQGASHAPYRRLLALLDTGDDARRVLDLALRMKSADSLFAVHACPKHSSGEKTAAAMAELERVIATALEGRCDAAATITPVVRSGDLASVLIEEWSALHPDLIVAATRKPHGLEGIFGHSHVADLLEIMPFDLLVTNLETRENNHLEEPAMIGDAGLKTKALAAARHLLRRG